MSRRQTNNYRNLETHIYTMGGASSWGFSARKYWIEINNYVRPAE